MYITHRFCIVEGRLIQYKEICVTSFVILFAEKRLFWWLSTRLQYLQWYHIDDVTVLYLAIDLWPSHQVKKVLMIMETILKIHQMAKTVIEAHRLGCNSQTTIHRMWGKIMIPMYALWLHGLYGLYGPRCPLSPERLLNLITHSLDLDVCCPRKAVKLNHSLAITC